MKPPNTSPAEDRDKVRRVLKEIREESPGVSRRSISIGIGPCYLPLFNGTAEDLRKQLQEFLDDFSTTNYSPPKLSYDAKGYTLWVPLDDGPEIENARLAQAEAEVLLACAPVIDGSKNGRLSIEWEIVEADHLKSGRFKWEVYIFAD